MVKIIYFTTAQDNNRYPEYLSFWNISPNLSNQNFHNKLIRALSLSHEMEVISIRPINKSFKLKELKEDTFEEGNITWKYVRVKNSKIDKFLNLSKRINNVLEEKYDESTVVFVDILNLTLVKNAYKTAKKHNLKIYGICTDNPLNISFTNHGYNEKLIQLVKSFDGYISLTKQIDELFNDGKPSAIIDGVTEEIRAVDKPNIDGKYIYFGGSLMHEYGLFNLIDAFKEISDKNIKLVIAGHHEPNDFKNYIKDNNKIVYVGALPYQEVVKYEAHALCCVNPRPINPKIDNYSIPSKTLEYLAAGAITITVNNNLLNKKYKDCIIWAKTGDKEDLLKSLNKVINLTKKEREALSLLSKNTVRRFTSFENINKLIDSSLF